MYSWGCAIPRKAKELSALAVSRLTQPGRHSVGGIEGLALSITDKGTRSWTLRVMVGGKRKEMGLGGYPAVSLAVAREQARQQRATLASGDDPIAARKARAHELRAAEEARKIASDARG